MAHFSLGDMIRCNADLRRMGEGARSMEEIATRVVGYFYRKMKDAAGAEICLLTRFYKTHRHADLPQSLKEVVDAQLGDTMPMPHLRCLTLLGTAGIEADWNDCRRSNGHRSIPLVNRSMVERAPMISQLIRQFGLEIDDVVHPEGNEARSSSAPQQFDVFFVPMARGSSAVPAQNDFVIRYGIESVLGFGGMLHSGDIFATILFTRTRIAPETAEMFKTMALSVKLAVLPFADRVFADEGCAT